MSFFFAVPFKAIRFLCEYTSRRGNDSSVSSRRHAVRNRRPAAHRNRSELAGRAKCQKLFRRNARLEFFEPVEDDLDLWTDRSAGPGLREHDEFRAVGCAIVVSRTEGCS